MYSLPSLDLSPTPSPPTSSSTKETILGWRMYTLFLFLFIPTTRQDDIYRRKSSSECTVFEMKWKRQGKGKKLELLAAYNKVVRKGAWLSFHCNDWSLWWRARSSDRWSNTGPGHCHRVAIYMRNMAYRAGRFVNSQGWVMALLTLAWHARPNTGAAHETLSSPHVCWPTFFSLHRAEGGKNERDEFSMCPHLFTIRWGYSISMADECQTHKQE